MQYIAHILCDTSGEMAANTSVSFLILQVAVTLILKIVLVHLQVVVMKTRVVILIQQTLKVISLRVVMKVLLPMNRFMNMTLIWILRV